MEASQEPNAGVARKKNKKNQCGQLSRHSTVDTLLAYYLFLFLRLVSVNSARFKTIQSVKLSQGYLDPECID